MPMKDNLTPTARILYWFRKYKKLSGCEEMTMKEVSEESGIPISTLYKAARELGAPITRKNSVMEM